MRGNVNSPRNWTATVNIHTWAILYGQYSHTGYDLTTFGIVINCYLLRILIMDEMTITYIFTVWVLIIKFSLNFAYKLFSLGIVIQSGWESL